MTTFSRGRPQASSQATLADAASELFLEQGYEATTVTDITKRAGVSRSTFFNYFDGKAATIWFALDSYLARAAALARSEAVLPNIAHELGEAPLHSLALAITNAETMGVQSELTSGRALRQAELARIIAKHDGGLDDALAAETTGAAHAAAIFSAIWGWAAQGAGAHRLDVEIERALSHRSLQPVKQTLRVAVIGAGAIGARVIEELASGNIAGATLAGVVTRRPDALARFAGAGSITDPITDFGTDIDRAIAQSDLIVECAGIPAMREYAQTIVSAGHDLLTVSIGALADPELRAALAAGPGLVKLSNGAIGGLDVLAAAARPGGIAGGITAASITSRKRASKLVQPWMSEEEVERLNTTTEEFVLFSGTVTEAIALFPGSLNIACALAQATDLWDETVVQMIADPDAARTQHRIEASGTVGTYSFGIANEVSPENPASSMIVAESVLRGIQTLAGSAVSFV